jgi:hypothetical protein
LFEKDPEILECMVGLIELNELLEGLRANMTSIASISIPNRTNLGMTFVKFAIIKLL